MKNFKNFGKYITSHRIKLKVNKDINNASDSKMDRMISGILSGNYANDEDAVLDLYKSKKITSSYRALKSRIKDRLLSHIFQVDLFKSSKLSKYSYEFILTNKCLTAGQFMINFGISSEGETILKQGLTRAKKYQFSGMVVFASRLLRSRAGFKGTRKEVVYYDQLIDQHLEIYSAELESDAMRDRLNIDFRESFSPKKKEMILSYWERIKYLNERFDNNVLKINKARIGSKYFETIGDFRSVIAVCDEVENYLLKNRQFYDLARHREFSLVKLEACLFLKDYYLGEINANTCMKLFANNINSLIVFEYHFILCIHEQKYNKARDLFNEALSNPLFKSYPKERIEKWKLFEAYLGFIYPDPKRKFKLFKFLNEVTVYSKDKRGLNISIMIAQIILLLDDGNFDMLIEKADSFRIYFKRYVTKHINYRTFYFVKMVEIMFKHNFSYDKVKQSSEKFYARLSDKVGQYHGDIESLEVIPYEELWEQILNRLKKVQAENVFISKN